MGRKNKNLDPEAYERIFFGTIHLRVFELTSKYMSDDYIPGWSSKILLGLSAYYAKEEPVQPILDYIDNEFRMIIGGMDEQSLCVLNNSRVFLKEMSSKVNEHPHYNEAKAWLAASIVSHFSNLEDLLGSAAAGVAAKALARLGAIESFYAGFDAEEAKKYFLYSYSNHEDQNDTTRSI